MLPWKSIRVGLLIIAAAGFGGCATVDPRVDFQKAEQNIRQATGVSVDSTWDEESHTSERVSALMADGLTSSDAAEIALLNNPRIHAAFQRIGMSRAEVVQAGLWSNPTLGISLRFPEAGGLANLEAGLAQNIADLWMIPARRRAAVRDLDRTILEVAREAAQTVNDTRVAYFNAVASDEVVAIAGDNLSLTQNLLRLTEARLEAGTVGSLDVNLIKGQALKADVEVRKARLEASTARRNLTTLMGLTTQSADLQLTESLPAPRSTSLDAARCVELALDSRLDVRAAREAVEAAAARVEFELARVFENVELGIELERGERRAPPGRDLLADTARASIANGGLTAPEIESGGQRRLEKSQEIEAILGPSLSLTLPIFDQNQAQIAKARFAYLEAKSLLAALDRAIVQETREAVDRVTTAWGVARLYEQEVLPQARKTLEYSESAYKAGQTPVLNVIDAQRSLLETRQANVATLQSAAVAMVDLERATSRPATILLETSGSSSETASQEPSP